MFGYVIINQQELKFREYDVYRSYYCGLCRELKEKYHGIGQLTLSYDTTFLALLLTGLYEPEDRLDTCKCIAHPFEKHPTRRNEYTEYAADINIILSYYSCADDWSDERKLHKLLLAKLLEKKNGAASARYEEKAKVIYTMLEKLHAAEKAEETDLDKVAGYFGELMAEIFAMKHDEWELPLRRMGFFLGKFIYIMDAYEDLEKDEKSGSFNPLLARKNDENFEEDCKQILTMMMAECCKAFETLPILLHVDILRNILYSGVWYRYQAVSNRRKEEAHV